VLIQSGWLDGLHRRVDEIAIAQATARNSVHIFDIKRPEALGGIGQVLCVVSPSATIPAPVRLSEDMFPSKLDLGPSPAPGAKRRFMGLGQVLKSFARSRPLDFRVFTTDARMAFIAYLHTLGNLRRPGRVQGRICSQSTVRQQTRCFRYLALASRT